MKRALAIPLLAVVAIACSSSSESFSPGMTSVVTSTHTPSSR